MATNVYVDAFNLYYGCLKGTPYRWLDLGALCTRLLPKDRINRIRYFTAMVSARPDDPRAPRRQQVYHRALETIPGLSIHYGHYLSHVVRMPLLKPPPRGSRTVEVVKTEEKSSDVTCPHWLRASFHPCSGMRPERFASRRAGSSGAGNAEARRGGPRTQPAKWLGGLDGW
jgi:hypothetical protein